MRVSIGIDIACRAAHRASCADETGTILWSGYRFRTEAPDLERLRSKIPKYADETVVVMEPTRNAWVALAAWFRRKGASAVVAPSEQPADLRACYSEHAKTDRLDSRLLARVPLPHPEGLHKEEGLGPGDALKRAVRLRSNLVMRRTTEMHRLGALLEIMSRAWVEVLCTRMNKTALLFLANYAGPFEVKRLKTRAADPLPAPAQPRTLGQERGRRTAQSCRSDDCAMGRRRSGLRRPVRGYRG